MEVWGAGSKDPVAVAETLAQYRDAGVALSPLSLEFLSTLQSAELFLTLRHAS
jgi:hypothetical protein